MTAKEFRCCVAEAIGAFAVVFFGCGAIATMGHSGIPGHVGINLVFGAVVAAMIFSLGHISCAHFNPAVTLGFAVARRFPWRLVSPYVFAQILGGIAACGALALFFPADPLQVAHFGATIPNIGPLQAVGLEGLLTMFLMLVIISVATDARVHPMAGGIAIGLTVMLCGLVAGSLTGNSLNPARSIGPALFGGSPALPNLWIYLIGPTIGAACGALVYEFLRASRAAERACPPSCC